MNKELIIKKAFDDVVWMAIRYANGRHTYAPSMVREAVNAFKEVFPDWQLKADKTINLICLNNNYGMGNNI